MGGVPGIGPSEAGVTPAQTLPLAWAPMKAMHPKKIAASEDADHGFGAK